MNLLANMGASRLYTILAQPYVIKRQEQETRMRKLKTVNTRINAEKNLVKRTALDKCHKLLSKAEELSKKHGFEMSCVFGNDGWNTEYINLDIQNTENSLQSIIYALIAIEFHHENVMAIEDVNDVVSQTIKALGDYKDDKINEIKSTGTLVN